MHQFLLGSVRWDQLMRMVRWSFHALRHSREILRCQDFDRCLLHIRLIVWCQSANRFIYNVFWLEKLPNHLAFFKGNKSFLLYNVFWKHFSKDQKIKTCTLFCSPFLNPLSDNVLICSMLRKQALWEPKWWFSFHHRPESGVLSANLFKFNHYPPLPLEW